MLKKEDKLLGTGRPIVATFWQNDYELYDIVEMKKQHP